MSYLNFDRVDLEHMLWTIEEAEAYLPTLKGVLEDLATLRARTDSLEIKLMRSCSALMQRQTWRNELHQVEQERKALLGNLQDSVDVHDEARGVVCFPSWCTNEECYHLVYRDGGIQCFCSMTDIIADRSLDSSGYWIKGRSKGQLAQDYLEEIPYEWRR